MSAIDTNRYRQSAPKGFTNKAVTHIARPPQASRPPVFPSQNFIFSCCKLTILFHRQYVDPYMEQTKRRLPLRTEVVPASEQKSKTAAGNGPAHVPHG